MNGESASKLYTKHKIPKSAFYHWINQIFEVSNQIYGAKKIRAVLIDQGYQVSPELITELMIEMGLESISKNAKREHLKQFHFEKKHNLLNNNFIADAPNQIWCSDFISFRLKDKRLHLWLIV